MTSNPYSYYTDPAQEFTLDLARSRDQADYNYANTLANDPSYVNRLAELAIAFPQGSAALSMALAQGGISASDPQAQQLYDLELQKRDTLGPVDEPGDSWKISDPFGPVDDKVMDVTRGSVRWAFAAWDGAWNLLAGGAPIRARQLAQAEDMSYSEAWKEQDPYFFEALGGLIAGERVNLGSGWFPQSDVAPGVEEQVNLGMQNLERSTSGMDPMRRNTTILEGSPGVWRDAIAADSQAQAELGKPLTQLSQVANESVMFDVNQWRGTNQGMAVQTPWSPGRMFAANITQPGTEPYKKISGFMDFGAQVFLDPVDWAGAGWAKAGLRGRKLWGIGKRAVETIDKAEDTARFASQAEQAGRVLGTGAPAPTPQEAADLMTELGPARLGTGRTTTAAIEPTSVWVGEGARKTPWWRVGSERARRTVSPDDPPQWFIDQGRRVREGALEGWEGTSRRVMNGAYEVDLPRVSGAKPEVARIFRRGEGKEKFWDVTLPDGTRLSNLPDDPRFSEVTTRFRTKAEAEDAVRRYAREGVGYDDLSHKGMSESEFIDSGEEFLVGNPDDVRIANRGSVEQAGRNGEGVAHRAGRQQPKVKRGKKPTKRGPASVRVFGKSVDLSSGLADDLPEGLKDALRADHKLRGNRIVGFGDPTIEKFDETIKWMEQNGYGKLHWDEQTTIIADNYIGGSPTDQFGRMRYNDQAKPMSSIDLIDETLTGPTPNDVQGVIDDIAETYAEAYRVNQVGYDASIVDDAVEGVRPAQGEGFGMPDQYAGRPGDVTEIAPGRGAAESNVRDAIARNSGESPLLTDGPRPDVVPNYQLGGRRADMFVARLSGVIEAGDAAKLDRLLKFASDAGVPVPNKVKRALLEAKSEAEIRNIFGKWLVNEGGQELLLPGGTQYGRLAAMGVETRGVGVAASLPSWVQRRWANGLDGIEINMVDDPSAAYDLFDRAVAHYNIKRNSKIARYDKGGIATGETIDIEEIFTSLRNLEPGNKGEAFNVMGRFAEAMFSSLVDDGVSPEIASNARRWWKESGDLALFDAERFGRIDLGSSPYDMGLVDGILTGGVGPQLTADLWSGQLKPPDARTMKRLTNESDALGRTINKASWKYEVDEASGIIDITDRAWLRFTDNAMTKVWKPFVLLRAAWTLRILLDDQLRMAAEGYSMFNNPSRVFSYVLSNKSELKKLVDGGTVDVFGTPMKLSQLDDMAHANKFQDAMMRGKDPLFGRGSLGYRFHERVGKDAGARYSEGLVFELTHLKGSPTTRVLAEQQLKGTDDTVGYAVRWLKSDEGAIELQNLVSMYRKEKDIAAKILAGDDETLRMIVNRQSAILNHKMGGSVKLDNGNGQLLDFDRIAGYGKSTEKSGKAEWIVEQPADIDLLKLVSGKTKIGDVNIGKLDTEESLKLAQELIGQKVKESKFFPQAVRGPKTDYVGKNNQKALGDDAVRKLFDWFMGMPSDTLSRSPEFRRAYWRKITELSPYMDEGLRAKVLVNAPPDIAGDIIKRGAKHDLGDVAGQLTDIDQLDDFAKSFGLTMVERTLFTMTNRKNVSDSVRLIFPFAEAWGEFISRWGRLMVKGDRNVKNLNRMRQGVMGARRSGFFSENDFGQETFAYPAFLTKAQVALHNTLNNIPGTEQFLGGDVSSEVADSIQATGNVESLNFVSGVIPGFGPVFQLGARSLSEDPKYDFVRDLIAPFGTEGGLALAFAPAWLKRIVSAQGGQNDETLAYTYNATVMDVMRTKIDRGDFAGVTSESEINALVREAEDEAKGLLMVRAAATYMNPASPSYKFQKEDKDGLVWSYSNLGQEYRKLEDEFGVEGAFDEFYKRFGFLPQAFRGGKTYSVVDRSLDESGFKYERANPDVFNDFPSVAMYFDPNIGAESDYSHTAMIRQLKDGVRENWTADQFTYLQQDQLGDIWWERIKSISALIEDSGRRKAYEASQREAVQEAYPRWNKPIPGKEQAVTNDQQREELLRAIEDPRLEGSTIIAPVKLYEQLREQVLANIREAGASSISGPRSTTTPAGQIATRGREWLRGRAEELELQFPEFGPVWRSVYFSEVSETRDAVEPMKLDYYGEGDPLDEMYGVQE